MTDNELLLEISILLDAKLKPLKSQLNHIESLLNNDILPRLKNIENCNAIQNDIKLINRVISEHNEKISKLEEVKQYGIDKWRITVN